MVLVQTVVGAKCVFQQSNKPKAIEILKWKCSSRTFCNTHIATDTQLSGCEIISSKVKGNHTSFCRNYIVLLLKNWKWISVKYFQSMHHYPTPLAVMLYYHTGMLQRGIKTQGHYKTLRNVKCQALAWKKTNTFKAVFLFFLFLIQWKKSICSSLASKCTILYNDHHF